MTLLNSQPLILDKKLAVILGLNEAVVLQQIHYWLEINKKNNRNFHEGRYWTYNTINERQKEFPFWSTSTIKRIFKRLRDMKLVEVDNFNVYQMDRTLWYTINYEELDNLCSVELDNIDADCEDNKVQSDQVISSSRNNPNNQYEPIEKVKETLLLPENTTKNSTDISNQSISYSQNNLICYKNDRPMEVKEISYKSFKDKYESIIYNCELYAIDERYREAVAHALRLLVLDTEKKGSIKIGNNYIPAQVVENDMKRINFFVIEHAVNKFKEASSVQKINNPLGYLKVLIYNSINEAQIDIDCKLRYENLIC